MTDFKRDRRRFHRLLDLLAAAAVALLPIWLWPPGGSTPESRRAATLLWLVVLAVVGLLALGAWVTGLVPPGRPR